METNQPCLDIKNDGRKRVKGSDGGDRISSLPDDVLVDILQCLDLRTVVRAGAVARRWRPLPRMLPDLDMDIATLIPHRRWGYSVDTVMATYTNIVTWFLLPAHHRTSLRLAFYLIDVDPFLRSISNAIATTTADRLELTIRRSYHPYVEFDPCFASFLAACPAAFGWLTSLALQDFSFSTSLEIAGLLDACHRLEILSLTNCHCTVSITEKLEIDAPSSSLLALELHGCSFHGVELARVPKLERFVCDTTTFEHNMSFGYVPCLRVINLSVPQLQCYFENPASLYPAFNSLRGVSLCGLDIPDKALILYVLDATPFLNNLSIKLTRRQSTSRGPYKFTVAGERPKFEHRSLSSLEIKAYGVSTNLDVMNYIRLIRKHAVCLKRILLLELCANKRCDGVTCLCQVEDKRKKILRDILNIGFSTCVEITIEPVVSKGKIIEQVTRVC